ncbi:MAG: hypothetical protein ACRCYS_13250, partial [Beijerinckiaceae bacterium]
VLLEAINSGTGPALRIGGRFYPGVGNFVSDMQFRSNGVVVEFPTHGAIASMPTTCLLDNGGSTGAHIFGADGSSSLLGQGAYGVPISYAFIGTPTDNLVLGDVARASLNGVVLPQGANIAIGVLSASGSFIAA